MKRGFVIHHNGPETNLLGKPHTKCVDFWTGVKRYHMQDKGWSNIAYSFGICHHGNRFDGCGWHKNQFANGSDQVGIFDGKDSEWYTVFVFIGYDPDSNPVVEELPTEAMIDGVKKVIQEGRDRKLCDYRVLPHNRFKKKRCPGDVFTALANVWDGQSLTDSISNDEPIEASTEEEDDDMFTFSTPGKPVFFVSGGVKIGLNEATDLENMRKAADAAGRKLMHFPLDDDTYDKFHKAYPGA